MFCSRACFHKHNTPKSEETRKKISNTLQGNKPWNWGIAGVVQTCLVCKKEFKIERWRHQKYCSLSCHTKLRHQQGKLKPTKKRREKISKKVKELWQNPEYRSRMIASAKNKKRETEEQKKKRVKAVLKALGRRPTGLEKKFIELIEKYDLPYKYVGDGGFWIGCFNPDFVECNGKKLVIELYSDYWHKLPNYVERDCRRIATYEKFSYKTLVLWSSDFYENKQCVKTKEGWEEDVLNKVRLFEE